ncbi:MAG TPA: alpha/beta fold hydrolase [Kofleriaceae bacterium]|nr:alpha/beta fold hydrolase [Kofleriaceae bacterium]
MQRLHSGRHLFWRGGIAAVSNALMFSGLYPLLPHAWRALSGHDLGERPVRAALIEWGASAVLSVARPAGFLPLPGARTRGPRPILVLHGYAMNRANFLPLAFRLARAGLGPVFGFEYWSLGRTAAAARQLGWFIAEVRAATGAAEVDLIGHSMGGIVGRYYVSLAGGDGIVRHLITIGTPHSGTEVSRIGIGHPTRELVLNSPLLTRLAAAPPPARTRVTAVWSRGDALVPGARQLAPPGAEVVTFPDLGHVALLGSRRVARVVIDRLSGRVEAAAGAVPLATARPA